MADKSHKVNRRNVLKGVGTTGLGAFGIGSVSAEEAGEEIEITVPSTDEKNQIISRARADERTRTLSKTLQKEGYTPNSREIKVSVTRQSGEVHHRTVLLPFQSKGKIDDERMILWTDLEENESEIPPVSSVTVDRVSEPGNRKVTMKTADGGVVSETQEADGRSTSSTTGPSVQAQGCYDGCYCCKEGMECESYNWACITYVVGSAAGTILACGLCAGSLGANPTCYACFIALTTNTAGYVAGADCYIGNNCTTDPYCTNPRMC